MTAERLRLVRDGAAAAAMPSGPRILIPDFSPAIVLRPEVIKEIHNAHAEGVGPLGQRAGAGVDHVPADHDDASHGECLNVPHAG